MVRPAGPGPGPPELHDMEVLMAMNDMDGTPCNLGSQFSARPALISRSLTFSGRSGDSGDYQDCNASPLFFSSGEPSLGSRSPDSISITQARDSAMLRYKEKRKNRRFVPSPPLFFELKHSSMFGSLLHSVRDML